MAVGKGLTCFDVSQSMDQYEDKLAHTLCPSHSHVQQTIVGIIVEGVAVGIVCQLFVVWYLVSKQQGHMFVLTMSYEQINHKATKFVDDKCADR